MGKGAEVAMGSGSRTAHGDPRPPRTPSREQLSSYFFVDFDEAVPVDYIHTSLDL